MDDEVAVLDFNDVFYFVQVVDRGGFTATGRILRIPKSTLSHRIQQLEANLGVRLLNRTSRRFGMTDAGEEFYRHAVVMSREAELAETAIRHRLNEPTGTVRCTAAVRLRHANKAKADVVLRLTPRLLSDDMIGLKQAAIAGLGIVALPGYVCREDVRSVLRGGYCPPGLLAIPQSRLSFRTGRACCHRSASSLTTWRQSSRKRS
jgi:DNA-binding transcriptional LysR family regulator